MWWITTYEPVTMFSLKVAAATSTGGKSLLLPTPFAFKMALLNTVIQLEGIDAGTQIWPAIRDGKMAIHGPAQIAVNNTFNKILKPSRGQQLPDPDTGILQIMGRSIGFREYVQWHGETQIAFEPSKETDENWALWTTNIHYLGKRGGFIQATGQLDNAEKLPPDFLLLGEGEQHSERFPLDGTLQVMDDCGSNLSFDEVNIYSSKNMRRGTHRILRPVILPYRMARSSRGYTLYERFDGAGSS